MKELLEKSHIIYDEKFFEEILRSDEKKHEMIVDDEIKMKNDESNKPEEIK